MAEHYRFHILGCGTSSGVPRIGPIWGDCNPDNPKNHRTRSSAFIEKWQDNEAVTRVLIDTGPDLRQQMLRAGLNWVDGVLYTHPHADHLHGIDDLRAFVFNHHRRVDVYASELMSKRLHEGFGYCFKSPPGSSYPPILNEHRIAHATPLSIAGPGGDIHILPFRQVHGEIHSLGFRFGNLAYSPDLNDLEPESVALLKDLDVWVVDALRYTPHPSHFSLEDVLRWVDIIKPKKTILTHMHMDLDYDTLKAALPANIEPAYDGMSFKF